MLTRFMQQHPALQVDLLATDEQVDIVGKGIDAALRRCAITVIAHRPGHNPRDLRQRGVSCREWLSKIV
jgi:DNA-binding transcriptional LysR family regulator